MASKSRCKICYHRERRNDPTAKSSDIKKRCANPTNGCVVCNIYVCSGCWQVHTQMVLELKGIREDGNGVMHVGKGVFSERSGSVVMESFLAINNMNVNDFLQTIWNRKTHLFTYDAEISPISSNPFVEPTSVGSSGPFSNFSTIPTRSLVPPVYGGDGRWRETNMFVFPLRETIRQGWHILTTFMSTDYESGANETAAHPTAKVSILKNSQPKTRDEIKKLYDGDLCEAYLSGCSIAWENCDLRSPYIAYLCHDLVGKDDHMIGKQDDSEKSKEHGTFNNACATAHLDPPQYSESFAQEKTNDQNIFVLQLAGRKYWKTYWKMPIDRESLDSKQGEETAPTSIYWKSMSFEGCLYPGDILYIPKGMTYQSQTQRPSEASIKGTGMNGDSASYPTMSFDVTIAIEKSSGSIENVMKNTATNDQTQTSVPDIISASSGTTDEVTNEQQDEKTKTNDSNSSNDVGIARKRSLVIEKAKEASQVKSQKRKPNPEDESRQADCAKLKAKWSEKAVGPIIASQISFQTAVRTSTQLEQRFCKERFLSEAHSDINQRRDEGIRPELRGVAKVIATMIRTMTTGDGKMRVCDLCELVKQAFGDKVEVYLVCELAILALIKREIENGNLAVHSL